MSRIRTSILFRGNAFPPAAPLAPGGADPAIASPRALIERGALGAAGARGGPAHSARGAPSSHDALGASRPTWRTWRAPDDAARSSHLAHSVRWAYLLAHLAFQLHSAKLSHPAHMARLAHLAHLAHSVHGAPRGPVAPGAPSALGALGAPGA